MSDLPNRLSPGIHLSANWLNRLRGVVSSLNLNGGPGLLIKRTPTGTTISLAGLRASSRTRPRPFACRIRPDTDGVNHLFCYLPPLVRTAIRQGETVVAPAVGVRIGSSVTPWVKLAAANTSAIYLFFVFPADASGAAPFWTIGPSAPSVSTGSIVYVHRVWANEPGLGPVQYHLGSILLPAAAGCAPMIEATQVSTETSYRRATKAATITVTPCSGEPKSVSIYNGKDGVNGNNPSGSFSVVDDLRIASGKLQYHKQPYQFDNQGAAEKDGAGTWHDLANIRDCV